MTISESCSLAISVEFAHLVSLQEGCHREVAYRDGIFVGHSAINEERTHSEQGGEDRRRASYDESHFGNVEVRANETHSPWYLHAQGQRRIGNETAARHHLHQHADVDPQGQRQIFTLSVENDENHRREFHRPCSTVCVNCLSGPW